MISDTNTNTPTPEKKTPWHSIRETFTFDTLRKTKTKVSTWSLPVREKTTTLGLNKQKTWTPPALRPFTLCLAILISLALFITLQLLILRSDRDQGVIFAPDINALPLSRTFMYRYFPTIVAVFYSMLWAWIDLETKRAEPWFRLSRKDGSKGADSLLLDYPSDFMPLVPFKAFKEKHWPVFWASFGLVLVAWGLVPVQAGIFSIHHISRNTTSSFNVSTSYISADQQIHDLSVHYAQSTYGIAALNETLPPYMTLNYTLAPFVPSAEDDVGSAAGEWTAPTTLYSLNLLCEPATLMSEFDGWNSSWGCHLPVGLGGNQTMATYPSVVKRFTGLYAGYASNYGATYYMDYCPPDHSHSFYAALTENKKREEDPPNNVTAIFCEPVYYEQDVNATVDRITQGPIGFVPLGPRRNLNENVFNKTFLDVQLADTATGYVSRGDFMPSLALPNYIEHMDSTELSIGTDGHAMVGLTATVSEHSLQDNLDWEILSASYAKAYRLLFARAMVDVLGSEVGHAKPAEGETVVFLDAVYLEPVFTYIVEGLLVVVIASATVLLCLSMTRSTTLLSDPNTLASIMSLVADDPALLADFKDLDCCTAEELHKAVCDKEYRLVGGENQINRTKIRNSITSTSATLDGISALRTRQRTGTSKEINKAVRPSEFSLWTSIPFVGLFVVLSAILVVIFIKARDNGTYPLAGEEGPTLGSIHLFFLGLPLPSKDTIVQNILENYIPTALATLIEPMWVLMNRLLCLLQPIEELSKGNAKAQQSIELNYSSLPPQLVLWKALRARHVVLTAVCAMALLTNLLAVSFAGLFYHNTVEVRIAATFQAPLEPTFVAINGSIGPNHVGNIDLRMTSGAYHGGEGQDQFLVSESNYTHGTPLPPWTDDRLFYMPFMSSVESNGTVGGQYEAVTAAFGAELECSSLETNSLRLVNVETELSIRPLLNLLIERDGVTVNCTSVHTSIFEIRSGPQGTLDEEPTCQKGPSAAEIVTNLEPFAQGNASKAERDVCWGSVVLGWLRDPEGSCDQTEEKNPIGENSFYVRCEPRLVKGHGTIRVDNEGRLLRKVDDRVAERNFDFGKVNATFNSDPVNLISQSNRYLFQSPDMFWHNDTFATEFVNYFVRRATNSSRLLDPKEALPTLEDVQVSLGKVYSSLFAIWLGTNKENLFVQRSGASSTSSPGWRVEKEERLFLTTALFIIAQTILSLYIIVAILVYIRRPGEYLPRMPTNIASIIGLFAASAAVQDMRGTSRSDARARAQHLRTLDQRYGYGNYVGVDGGIHVGIEKVPFVRARHSTARQKSFLATRKTTAV
ncbi:hypothetical protein P280DRAFT_386551 [Massarina eburnea CBS 473.64]|uniref:Uncharacterized protein n=1 Tax=Massarina eburnea CBS 473.64 TaxID=1395130 RepID=A0A6A6SHV4_9PLEO|nr:hypothetical protein P280DRAFT_386551 [Massarina eburnea CBS 473.64]